MSVILSFITPPLCYAHTEGEWSMARGYNEKEEGQWLLAPELEVTDPTIACVPCLCFFFCCCCSLLPSLSSAARWAHWFMPRIWSLSSVYLSAHTPRRPTPLWEYVRACVCVCVCFERLWFFFCLNAATEWVPSLQSSLDFTVNLFVIRNHFGARTNKALWFGSGCTQKARWIFFNYNTTVAWQLSRLLCRLPNVTWEMTATEQKNWETVIWCYEMWCDVMW